MMPVQPHIMLRVLYELITSYACCVEYSSIIYHVYSVCWSYRVLCICIFRGPIILCELHMHIE